MSLTEVIEALIFASQKPLSLKEIVVALRAARDDDEEDEAIRALAGAKEAEAAAALEQLKIDYIQSGRAFQLVEQAGGWAVVTKPDYGPWVRQLYPESKPARLSGPALETLAIIAYRQPITRADIEAVRGVAVDGVMQSLLDRSLVRIAGRAEVPGRPLLYETTQVFLDHFGLKALDDLPNSDELRRVHLPTAPREEEKPEAPAEAGGAVENPEAADTEAEAAPEAETRTEEPVAEEPAVEPEPEPAAAPSASGETRGEEEEPLR